jgi:hypothetical protein
MAKIFHDYYGMLMLVTTQKIKIQRDKNEAIYYGV